MSDFEENDRKVKRSKAEVAVYGFTIALLIFFFFASILMVLISPSMGGGFFSYVFLLSPLLVLIALIGVLYSNRKRSKTQKQTQEDIANGILPLEKKVKKYGNRLLIMVGVVILGCITAGIVSLAISFAPKLADGDVTVIVVVPIAGIGAFGTFKLIQLLRQ